MLMMELDPATHQLKFAAAGHMPPQLRRSSGRIELPGRECFGPPLGTAEDSVFAQHSMSLEPGESFLLYTDGVTEARSGEDMFGDQRLAAVLARETTATAIGQRLVEEVVAFLGKEPRQDDLCIVSFGRQ